MKIRVFQTTMGLLVGEIIRSDDANHYLKFPGQIATIPDKNGKVQTTIIDFIPGYIENKEEFSKEFQLKKSLVVFKKKAIPEFEDAYRTFQDNIRRIFSNIQIAQPEDLQKMPDKARSLFGGNRR